MNWVEERTTIADVLAVSSFNRRQRNDVNKSGQQEMDNYELLVQFIRRHGISMGTVLSILLGFLVPSVAISSLKRSFLILIRD